MFRKKEQLEGLLSAGSDVPASPISICWRSSAWRPQRYLMLSLWFYLVDPDWKGGGPTLRSFGRVLALRSWGSSVGPFVQKLLAAAVEVGLLLGLLLVWTSRRLVGPPCRCCSGSTFHV